MGLYFEQPVLQWLESPYTKLLEFQVSSSASSVAFHIGVVAELLSVTEGFAIVHHGAHCHWCRYSVGEYPHRD